MTAAREAILARIEAAAVPALERPPPFEPVQPPSVSAAEVALVSGAACIDITALPTVLPSEKLYSFVPEAGTTADLASGTLDAASLLSIDTTVCRADFIVRENGAVWIPAASMTNRAALFTCRRLVVLLHPDRVVGTMNDALRIVAERPSDPGYFIAGPSKTADIEQCLVVGAQGARSVTIVITHHH